MIQAQLPDGTALQFPDGTADSVIDQAVSEHVKTAAPQGGEHGYAYAPPEQKPPPAPEPDVGNPMGDQGGMGGSPLPAAAPNPASAASTLPIFPAPRPGALRRIGEAAYEGGVNTPDASGWAPGGLELGRYLVNPLLELGGGALRGGLQFLSEAAGGDPQLTRDVQALPEVFPTGVDMPIEPESALAARNVVRRATPRTQAQGITDAVTSPFSATRPITVQEITDAIKRSDINAAEPPPNQMMPGETAPPNGPAPAQPQPASTAAPQAPATSDTTGLVAGVGGMGKGISDSLRDHLWDQLQKGDLTEAGAPSSLLQTAKANVDSGAIKTRADFDRFYEEYGNRMAAQRQGQQPPPQPDATAPPQPAAPAAVTPPPAVASTLTHPAPNGLGPEAVGADVTRSPIPAMTPTETQDAFEKSVLQTAEQRTQPGPNGTMVDETQYIPNAVRTDSARIMSPEKSVYDQTLKNTDPEGYGKNALKIENDAKDTIFDNYKAQAGDKHAVDEAVKTRDAFSPDQLGVFENQRPTAQGQGIVDYFNRLLDGPEGKRGNVASILREARDGFLDNAGNAETMPNVLYGGRKNVTDILNEALSSSTSARKASVQAARKFLTDALENHIDPAINDGAPLFDTFRSQWSALSKPIDRMNFLQEHMFGPGDVRGGDGKIFFQGVQNLLEKMVKLRRATGNNAAKSFDLEHLDQLVNIRNELAAWHLRDRLQSAAGSQTVQRATAAAKLQSGPLGQAIAKAADWSAMAAAQHWFGEAGMMGYHTVGSPIVQRAVQYPAARKLERLKTEMLNTTPRNQLGP